MFIPIDDGDLRPVPSFAETGFEVNRTVARGVTADVLERLDYANQRADIIHQIFLEDQNTSCQAGAIGVIPLITRRFDPRVETFSSRMYYSLVEYLQQRFGTNNVVADTYKGHWFEDILASREVSSVVFVGHGNVHTIKPVGSSEILTADRLLDMQGHVKTGFAAAMSCGVAGFKDCNRAAVDRAVVDPDNALINNGLINIFAFLNPAGTLDSIPLEDLHYGII